MAFDKGPRAPLSRSIDETATVLSLRKAIDEDGGSNRETVTQAATPTMSSSAFICTRGGAMSGSSDHTP